MEEGSGDFPWNQDQELNFQMEDEMQAGDNYGSGDGKISSKLYKNDVKNTPEAKEAFYKISRVEFNSTQKLLQEKAIDPDIKCASGSSLKRKKEPKILFPSPFLQCPFGHKDGTEYFTDPLQYKKSDSNRNRGIRTGRKKDLPTCKHCLFTKFNLSNDPEDHYEDYIKQAFQLREHNLEDSNILFRQELKDAGQVIFQSKEEEEEYCSLCLMSLLTTELSPATPSNWLDELKEFMDPEKKYNAYQDSLDHQNRHFRSAAKPKSARTRYGIRNALKNINATVQSRRAALTPRTRPMTGGGAKLLVGRKLDFTTVKSRYLKKNNNQNLDDEGEAPVQDNPFPMPGDKIRKPETYKDFLKKNSKTSKLSVVIPKVPEKSEDTNSAKPIPANRPKQTDLTFSSPRKLTSSRLEALSKPVAKKTRPKSARITRKIHATRKRKPKAKVEPISNEKKTKKNKLPVTKKKSKILKTSNITSNYGQNQIRKNHSNKFGKTNKNNKKQVLSAFGFEFLNVRHQKDSTEAYESEDDNFSKEKYRRYVLRMLEKSIKDAQAQQQEESTKKVQSETIKDKIVESSSNSSPRKPLAKLRAKESTSAFKIAVSSVNDKEIHDRYPKLVVQVPAVQVVPEEKVKESTTPPLSLKTPSTVKLELPSARILKHKSQANSEKLKIKKPSKFKTHKDRGDVGNSNTINDQVNQPLKTLDKKSNMDSTGGGGDEFPVFENNFESSAPQVEINILESVISTSKYYKGLKVHPPKSRVRRAHFYSSSHLTPRFPVKTILSPEWDSLNQ